MKSITIGKATVDLYDGPVGILLSGGADSSVLLYILLKYLTGPVHVYTVASKQKNRASVSHTANVIGKCIDLTNNTNVLQHILYVPEQTFVRLHLLSSEDLLNNKINIVYTGVTSAPPDEVRATFTVKSGVDSERDPNIMRPVYYRNNKVHTPFYNIDKQAICEIYELLEIKNELFPLTRSCEDLNLRDGHCGKCWWCQERLWGFGYL